MKKYKMKPLSSIRDDDDDWLAAAVIDATYLTKVQNRRIRRCDLSLTKTGRVYHVYVEEGYSGGVMRRVKPYSFSTVREAQKQFNQLIKQKKAEGFTDNPEDFWRVIYEGGRFGSLQIMPGGVIEPADIDEPRPKKSKAAIDKAETAGKPKTKPKPKPVVKPERNIIVGEL